MSTAEFNSLVAGYSAPLQRFAHTFTGNKEEAKDLLQDTLLKAYVYKDSFTNGSNVQAWLFTIMRNTFINNIRMKKLRSAINNNYITADSPIAQRTGTAPDAFSRIAVKDMNRAISALDDLYRTPFMMYFEGYKYKEIAEHCNLPQGTIKSRIFLARKQLMMVLGSTV